MSFRIAYTPADSLSKLTGEEPKVVNAATIDLPLNPAKPSMRFQEIKKATKIAPFGLTMLAMLVCSALAIRKSWINSL